MIVSALMASAVILRKPGFFGILVFPSCFSKFLRKATLSLSSDSDLCLLKMTFFVFFLSVLNEAALV